MLLLRFSPFEDMRNVRKLILTAENYQFFAERLKWSIENKREDGGIIAVRKNGYMAMPDYMYVVPDEFKTESQIDMYSAEISEWYKALLSEVRKKRQRIGLYYHTHSAPREYGSEIHEEGSTARRTRSEGLEFIMDQKERELSIAKRKLGDVIVETVCGKMHMHGYTPAGKPYREFVPSRGHRIRETYSLEIVAPELNIRFDSFVD